MASFVRAPVTHKLTSEVLFPSDRSLPRVENEEGRVECMAHQLSRIPHDDINSSH